MITEFWNWLCTYPSIVNHYRGLRLLNDKNCIPLLYEHNVAAVLANNLGISSSSILVSVAKRELLCDTGNHLFYV